MRKPVLVFATSALVLVCGVSASNAQQSSRGPVAPQLAQQQAPALGATQHSETTGQGGMMMGPGGMGRAMTGQGGMMGRGMMGAGMMGGPHGMRGPHRGAAPVMRVIFALMDANSDGTISLQEWQAAQERIYKAMDVNKDGKVTFDEMRAFIRGWPAVPQTPAPPPQQQPPQQQPPQQSPQ